jgi:hypothetical protein
MPPACAPQGAIPPENADLTPAGVSQVRNLLRDTGGLVIFRRKLPELHVFRRRQLELCFSGNKRVFRACPLNIVSDEPVGGFDDRRRAPPVRGKLD